MYDQLSRELLTYADQLERELHDDLAAEDRDEYWKAKKLIEGIVRAVIVGREKITAANIEIIETLATGRNLLSGWRILSRLQPRFFDRRRNICLCNPPLPQALR